MRTRHDILQILAEQKPLLEKRYGVRRLALFGSYARGDQHEGSDVDILVDVDPRIGLGFVTLAEELEQQIGEPVELVSRRAIKPRHWEVIQKELIDVA